MYLGAFSIVYLNRKNGNVKLFSFVTEYLERKGKEKSIKTVLTI